MKYIYFIAFAFCFPLFVNAQQRSFTTVYTADIDRFWIAFDSVATTSDTAKQLNFIQKLYVDKGTEGLKAFMKARDYNAKLWVALIHKYPAFWKSIRSNTLLVKGQVPAINKSIQNFKKLYPEMKPAKMYFTVGGLRSGGTTTNDMVLVGTEIATADKNTDASELNDWLKNVFKNQESSNLVALNVHEYVHTQQKPGEGNLLLAQTITEGAADFIAELVTQRKNNSAYMLYGRAHEKELKEKFRIEMFSTATGNWLYNGSSSAHADLGYFMGYVICQAYYQSQHDKKQAIKKIIELDYTNEQQIADFLRQSGYYTEPIDKQELLKQFESLQPEVVSLYPNVNLMEDVLPTLTELTLNFSEPMDKGYSIAFGEGGKDHFPISGIAGFSDDRKSFKLKLNLQPGKTYDFVINGNGFKSKTGYPLKSYTVHFKVK
ncbi:Ig-like domain-containing protein [Mucilaginibacter xinganensis]|uniref:Putative Zn-dependent protease n=1 Tax=Mucilaginibacter xinganensis TaxID=1234841 RepID=A0A223P154_9SPHI|nr:Ig-like domain-containing protein [Mucilaginibacter xinganensis]ASU35879.1 putative Zn-dependent protease [Mucilaginibacter xinganensis]